MEIHKVEGLHQQIADIQKVSSPMAAAEALYLIDN
jgi:hypothetical protein